MKNLPIGVESFSKIRDKENNYFYVDKTKFAYDLFISKLNMVLLSRPRRFGKSLFVNTLKELFEGNKELFEGLYIYDKWNWDEIFPVIHISFSSTSGSKEKFLSAERTIIKEYYNQYDIAYDDSESIESNFSILIKEVFKLTKKKVVILIDEYDKPILDRIENEEERDWVKTEVSNLYSCLKKQDSYIKFALLTGVTKFNQVSIFSGLNNLVDISLLPDFADICGYTNYDLDTVFKERVINVNRDKLREYYDGYDFNGSKLYAPQDILQFFRSGNIYDNYWFSSGTPTYLVKLLETNKYNIQKFDTNSIKKTSTQLLTPYDVEKLDLPVLLFQSGYLSIKEKNERDGRVKFILDFPNISVRSSFYKILCEFIYEGDVNDSSENLFDALYDANFDLMEKTIRTLFAGIPHQYNPVLGNDKRLSDYEGYYSSIIFSHLKSTNVYIEAESSTNHGRLDLYVRTVNYHYIFEFKVTKTDALAQIEERKYFEKYLGDTKRCLYLVGINFDIDDKNFSKFEYKQID
ncbi:MAG: AAA family ATPase [Pleomorphochaeta sp.]